MSDMNVSVPLSVLRQLLRGETLDTITMPPAAATNGPTNLGGHGGRGGHGGFNGRGKPNGRGKQPCRFFQQGLCRNGTNCTFAHEGKEGAQTTRVQSAGGPCRHYMMNECTHETKTGAKCQFPHPVCPMIARNEECRKNINCLQGCPERSRAKFALHRVNKQADADSSQPTVGQSAGDQPAASQ